MARTAETERVGILNVNKPTGWTSHDVVARVRRLADQRRVGHAGTLDPLASGVLPVLLGRATRLADFIHLFSKTYVACVRLGIATDTDDAEGTVIATSPAGASSSPAGTRADAAQVLARFQGTIEQVPPRFSAVKVGGQRAYAAARRGQEIALQPRRVTIHALELLRADAQSLELEVTCSTGTYIRSLARDIAIALGTVGHLTSLVRTRVGPFCLTDAVSLETLAEGVDAALLPPDSAVLEFPELRADPVQVERLASGQSIGAAGLHADAVRVYDPDGRLVCIGTADATSLRCRFLL